MLSTKIDSGFCNPVAAILDAIRPDFDPSGLPLQAGQACVREHSLRAVFSPEVAAAHRDGSITVFGLDTPLELTSGVLGQLQPGERGLIECILRIRKTVGQTIAIDGPEYTLAFTSGAHDDARDNFARELLIGLRATGLRAVVNLNSDTPPRWASEFTAETLFDEPIHPTRPEPLAEHADGVADQLLRPSQRDRIRIDWHIGPRDFTEDGLVRLTRVGRRAAEGANLSFVFDRLAHPIELMEGLDRRHPYALLSVGILVPHLFERFGSAEHVQRHIEELARLAVCAGVQKRDFLRRHRPGLCSDHAVARARLTLVLLGLEAAVRMHTRGGANDRRAGTDLARRLLDCAHDALMREGEGHDLMCCLETEHEGEEFGYDHPHRRQVDAAAQLHPAGAGTATITVPHTAALAGEELLNLLRHTWENTKLTRFRIVRTREPSRQLTAPWELAH